MKRLNKYQAGIFFKTDHELSPKEKRNIQRWIKAALTVNGGTVKIKSVTEINSADAYKF